MASSAVNPLLKWRRLINEHLGRNYIKQSQQLMLDLLSVDCGLKPAVLLDFPVPSVASISSLLKSLKLSNLLKRDFLVVTVELDVLIFDAQTFANLKNSCEDIFSSTVFIDISANLVCPRIISGFSDCLQETRSSFCRLLEEQVSGSTAELSVRCDNGSKANPSTLFGLFLNYPVVYFYDVSLDSPSNCLTMVPLMNFMMKGKLRHQSDYRAQMGEHCVFSFTVPEAFADVTEGKVESWFADKKISKKWQDLFVDLTLVRRLVRLPVVCL